jgi:hypothetical protein
MQDEVEDEDMKIDLGDLLEREEEDMKIDLGDLLEREEEDMKIDLGDLLEREEKDMTIDLDDTPEEEKEEEDKKMDVGDFLEVLVKGEEGEGNEEQEAKVLDVKAESEGTDGFKVLSAEEFAAIKSRLDGREIRNRKDLAEFRKIVDEIIYQRVKRGSGGNNFWCRVENCKLKRGQRQKMRDHVEAYHVDGAKHYCTSKSCNTEYKSSASLAQHMLKKH